jgi:hypothetical protein
MKSKGDAGFKAICTHRSKVRRRILGGANGQRCP